MPNRRKSQVNYRRFEVEPRQQEGLLSVARAGGDLERKVAAGLARMSEQVGARADRAAAKDERAAAKDERLRKTQADKAAALDGHQRGRRDAFAAAPQVDYSGSGAPASGGIRVSTQGSNEDASKARDYLVSKHGLKPHQAAAIAGHGMQESAFNTQAVGDNGTAFGVFQWRGDRARNLRGFAKKSGRDWHDLETQLDFMVSELKGPEAKAWHGLQKAGNLQDAVTAFMHFERPQGYTVANPAAGHAFENRLAYAQGLVGNDKAAVPGAAAVGPVNITPVSEGAPVQSNPPAGGFQPTGSNSIRGRAYDVAGTRTYLEQLDVTMRQEQEQVYEAYKDNPAMLTKAMGELKQWHIQEHIIPDIAPEYSAAFDRSALGYMSTANKRAEKRQLQQNQSDFLIRTEDLEGQQSRVVAGMDPDAGDEIMDTLEDQQQAIEAHYESAVARNLMTPAKAEAAKTASRSNMMLGFYVRQMEGKTAGELENMSEEIRKDYAAGNLAGLEGDGFNALMGELKTRSSSKEIEDKKVNRGLQKRADEMVVRASRGEEIPEEEVTRFKLDAETASKGEKISKSTDARMRVADAIRSKPIGEVERDLEKILKGDDKAISPEDIAFARQVIALHRQELSTDPLGVAERFGVIPVVSPLPVGIGADMSGVKSAFEDRIDEAKLVAEYFGVLPKYIRPGEAQQILAQLDEDPANGLAIAGGLVEAAGTDAPQLLRELGREARPIAQAGAIMAVSGNHQAAMDAIVGSRKGSDGKMRKAPTEDTMRAEAAKMFGSALSLHPAEAFRLSETAANISRVRLEAMNIDPTSNDALPVYRQALQEAAGATFVDGLQYGGFAEYDPGLWWSARKVVVPVSIRADKLEDVVAALNDKDLAGLKVRPMDASGRLYTAAELKGAMLVATESGFRFAAGAPESANPRWYRGFDGRPFVLDLEDIPALRLRVPSAFKE